MKDERQYIISQNFNNPSNLYILIHQDKNNVKLKGMTVKDCFASGILVRHYNLKHWTNLILKVK